jgi:hypothetical protein
LLKKQIRKEAMKNISGDYPLTKEIMLKYRDKLDWSRVSGNSSINWTVDMIKTFEHQIDWEVFSNNVDDRLLCDELIEQFKDKWDWKELSGNSYLRLTYELIDKYIDKWDWSAILRWGRWNRMDKLLSLEFLNRYQQYIPIDDLETSQLWQSIIDNEEEAIKKEFAFSS